MSSTIRDLSGKRFGRLKVIGLHPVRSSNGHARWMLKCDCGKSTIVQSGNLVSGTVKSCGCWRRDCLTKHGFFKNGQRHPLWGRWLQMRGRCQNPKNDRYRFYGGRGIKLCKRWQSFEQFVADVGPSFRKGLTLERKRNSGPYCPRNCIWASWTTQANNKRTNRLLTVGSTTRTLAQWVRRTGMCESTITRRIKRGWSHERAIKTSVPRQRRNPETKLGSVR